MLYIKIMYIVPHYYPNGRIITDKGISRIAETSMLMLRGGRGGDIMRCFVSWQKQHFRLCFMDYPHGAYLYLPLDDVHSLNCVHFA